MSDPTPPSAAAVPAKHDPYASLRHRDFRWLVLSYGSATVAREGQVVVVGWQIYEMTRDPLSLGLIGLAEALPFIAASLYAGHIADRMERRRIVVAGTLGLLLSAIALLLFTVQGMRSVWPMYLVIFLSGIARSFTRPAMTALSAALIPREHYANAVAWRTSTWQAAAIAGPALGGLMYGFAGAVAAYACVCVLMAIALAALAGIAAQPVPEVKDEMPIGESLRAGIRFLKTEPVMLAAMTLDLFSVLFGGAAAMLPVFAKLLSAGPQGLGILRAAPAIGSIGTGIWLAHRPPMKRAGPWLIGAVAVFGLSIIGFALSRSFWLSFAILVIGGMADSISVVIRSTLVQVRTPPHMLGRVSAVNQVFIGASNEIGAFESGVAARLMGVVPSVLFGGCMTLVVVAITAWKAPQLRKLREL